MLNKLIAKPLKPEEINGIVAAKLDWILECCQPSQVWLFGSASLGTMTQASDIDLMLVFDNEHLLRSGRKNLYKNRPDNDWPHDLVFHTKLSWKESIDRGGGAAWLANREGKLLFNRNFDSRT